VNRSELAWLPSDLLRSLGRSAAAPVFPNEIQIRFALRYGREGMRKEEDTRMQVMLWSFAEGLSRSRTCKARQRQSNLIHAFPYSYLAGVQCFAVVTKNSLGSIMFAPNADDYVGCMEAMSVSVAVRQFALRSAPRTPSIQSKRCKEHTDLYSRRCCLLHPYQSIHHTQIVIQMSMVLQAEIDNTLTMIQQAESSILHPP